MNNDSIQNAYKDNRRHYKSDDCKETEQLKKTVIDNYEQSKAPVPIKFADTPKKITVKDIGKGIGFYIVWTIFCFVFLGVLFFIIDRLF